MTSYDAQPLDAALVGAEAHGALDRGTYHYTRVWARDDTGERRVVGGHVSAVT